MNTQAALRFLAVAFVALVALAESDHAQVTPDVEKEIDRFVGRSLEGRAGLLSFLRRHSGPDGADVRRAVFARLEARKGQAFDVLLRLLRTNEEEIGEGATRSLERIAVGHDELVAPLVNGLHRPRGHWDIVPRTARVLGRIGPKGVTALVDLLDDDTLAWRQVAFEQMRTLDPPPKVLLDTLVRRVRTSGRRGDESADMLARLGRPGLVELNRLARGEFGLATRKRAVRALIQADRLSPDADWLTKEDRLAVAEALINAKRAIRSEAESRVLGVAHDRRAEQAARDAAGPKIERGLRMLITCLHQGDVASRVAALDLLARYPEHAVKVVEDIGRAAEDPSPEVRQRAVAILGKRGPASRMSIDHVIGGPPSMSEAAEAAVVQRLKDRDARIRKEALDVVVRSPSLALEATEPLVRLLSDSSAGVRTRAARALALVVPPPKTVIDALSRTLEDSNLEVAQAAATALRRLLWKADGKLPALAAYRESDRVKNWRAERRGELLKKIASGPRRREQVDELVRILGRDAIPDLRRLLMVDDDSLRFAVLEHLGRMRAKEAIPDILPLIRHRVLLIGAAKALFMIDAEGTEDAIEKAFDRGTRRQAKAMSMDILNFRPHNAAPSLLKFLDLWGLDCPGWVVRGIAASERKEYAARMMRLLEDLGKRRDPANPDGARRLLDQPLTVTALEALGALDPVGYRDVLKEYLHIDDSEIPKREHRPQASDCRWAAAVALARLQDPDARDYFCKIRRSDYLTYYTAPKMSARLESLAVPYDGSVQTFHDVVAWLGDALDVPIRVTGDATPALYQARFDRWYGPEARKVTALELLRTPNRFLKLPGQWAAIVLETEVKFVPEEDQKEYWRRTTRAWHENR